MEARGTLSPVVAQEVPHSPGETRGMIHDENAMGMLSLSIAETFGKERISRELAASMRTLLPRAEFVRVSLRSGTGLFVTENLLKDGYCMVNLVSLKHSLSAQCMRLGSMLQIKVPDYAYGADCLQGEEVHKLGVIGVAPVMVRPIEPDALEPLAVGSLIVGLCSSEFDRQTLEGINALSQALGESLLTVGLEHVSHLAHLLLLRDQDSEFLGGEEPMQDLPWDVPRPFGAQEQVDSQEAEMDTPFRRIGSSLGEESDGSDDDFLMMYLRDAGQGLPGDSTIGPDMYGGESSEDKEVEEHPGKDVSRSSCDLEKPSSSDADASKTDVKERFIRDTLPGAGVVRTFAISLMCILVQIGYLAVAGKESMSLFSVLSLLAACVSASASGSALLGRNAMPSVDSTVVLFAVLNTMPSVVNVVAAKDEYSLMKRDLLRSILFFETTLMLCLERKSYAFPAHIGACIALAVASVVAS